MTNRPPDKPPVRMWAQSSGPPDAGKSPLGIMYESTDNQGRRYFVGVVGNERWTMYADKSARLARGPIQWRLYSQPLARPPRPIEPSSGK